ncbi:g8735 [Coccomyxa elongata]
MFLAGSRELLLVSRLAVLVFALFSGVWSIALIHIGIDINWLFFVIGLLVASVFPPISFLLTWNAVPKGAAIASALGGQAAAIIAWLVSTKILYDDITITTTSASGPSLAGNLVAIIVSAIICIVWTLIAPDRNASWEQLRADLHDKVEVLDGAEVIDNEKENPAAMAYAYKMTWIWAGCLSVVVFVLWPLLTLPAGVFSQSYFTFWIVLMMIWGFLAALVVIFYPLIEAREIFYAIFGFGPLAKRRRECRAINNSPNGHAIGATELGTLHKGNLPSTDFKPQYESESDAKIEILNGGTAAAAP